MIQKNREKDGENDTSDAEKSLGVERIAPDRIRQVQSICWLLDREATSTDDAHQQDFLRQLFSANSFIAGLCAVFVFLLSLIGLILWTASRPSLQRIPDYRWGETYESKAATALLVDVNQVHLATRGNGVQSFDQSTHFFKTHSVASSKNGLLSNDVLEIQQGKDGQLYFLCDTGESQGICSAEPTFNEWKTLIAADRFPGLSDEFQEQITDVLKVGDDFWIATRDAGIGVYSTTAHSWVEVYKANENELLSDQVWDLAYSPQGDIWIATSAGLNFIADGEWTRFTGKDGLLSDDIRQISFHGDQLWYRTSRGGIGRSKKEKWEVVWSEDRWGDHNDESVAAISDSPDSNVIWWADKTGEVAAYDVETAGWKVFQSPLTDQAFTSLAIGKSPSLSKTDLWIGTDKGLISASSSSSNQLETKTFFPDQKIIDVQANSKFASTHLSDADSASEFQVLLESGKWEKRLGDHPSPVASPAINDLAIDADNKVAWFATSKGLFPYSLQQHDWQHEVGGESRQITEKEIIDVEVDKKQLAFLDSEYNIQRWAQNTKQIPSIVLGEGKFPGDAQSITAVVRDQNGLLWIGTEGHGLYTYSDASRSWRRSNYNSKRVDQIVVSKRNVWVLADGQVRVAANADLEKLVKVDLRLNEVQEIFSHPEADLVVALGTSGKVVTVSERQSEQVIVGAPVEKFDSNSINAVGVLDETILFAGAANWAYNSSSRSWKTIATKFAIKKIVASDNSLWTLTSDGEIFEFTGDSFRQVPEAKLSEVIDLDIANDTLLLLGKSGNLQALNIQNKQTQQLLAKAGGPTSEEVTAASQLQVVADDLYLTAGEKSKLWKYTWIHQSWSQITYQGLELEDVSQVKFDGSNVYALTAMKGDLFKISQDSIIAQKENQTEVRHISGLAQGLVKTDSTGQVHRLSKGDWLPILDQLNSGLTDASQLFDTVETSQGYLMTTDGGSAILDKSLSSWRTIPGNQVFMELVASQDGNHVWGKDDRDQLAYLDQENRSWKSVPLAQNEKVSALAIRSTENDVELFVTTQKQSIYQIRTDTAERVWQPTKSKQPLSSAVSVISIEGGFLWLFKNGDASYYDVHGKVWKEVTLPGQPLNCVNWQGEQTSSLALLDSRGQVHTASAQQPLNWKLLTTDISQIDVAEGNLFSLSKNERNLKQWKSATEFDVLFTGHSVPGLGSKLVAVQELPSDHSNSPSSLLIAGETTSAVYSPSNRMWSPIPEKLSLLHQYDNSVLGLNADQELVRIEWFQGQAKLTTLKTPEIADFTIYKDQIYVRLVDGSISILNEAGELDLRVGNQLPKELAKSTIRTLSSDGKSLYLLTEQGETFRYTWKTRSWKQLPELSNLEQIHLSENAGWGIKKEENSTSLVRLALEDQGIGLKTILTGIVNWNLTPTGEASCYQKNDKTRSWQQFNREGELVTEFSTNAGPAAKDISDFGVHHKFIVMMANDGKLHIHDTNTGKWVLVLMNEPIAEYKLYDDLILCSTEKQELYAVQPDQDSGNWISKKLLEDVKAFDFHNSQLAWIDSKSVSVSPIDKLNEVPTSIKSRELIDADFEGIEPTAMLKNVLLNNEHLFLFSSEKVFRLSQSLEGEPQAYDIAAVHIARNGETALIETVDGLFSFQNQQWGPITGEFADHATIPSLLLQPKNGLIQVPYPTLDGTTVVTRYRENWFEILSPVEKSPQSSFAFSSDQLFLNTADGVIHRNPQGLRKLKIDIPTKEFVHGMTDENESILLVTDGEIAFRIDSKEIQQIDSFKELITKANQLNFNIESASFNIADDHNSASVEWSTSGQKQELNLLAGGFEDDQIIDLVADETAIYFLTKNKLYSLDQEGIKTDLSTEKLQLNFAGAKLIQGKKEILLVADGRSYRVQQTGLQLTNELPADSFLTLDSTHWKITPQGSGSLDVILKGKRQSHTEFSLSQGFHWDHPESFIVSPNGIFLTCADGITRYRAVPSDSNSISDWQDVSDQVWENRFVSSTGEIWATIADEWSKFDSDNLAWVRVGELPASLLAEQYFIADSQFGQLSKSGNDVEFNQKSPTKQDIVTSFQDDGTSRSFSPLAVIPVSDGNWWLAAGSLRKYDQAGTVLAEQVLNPPIKNAFVKWSQDQWYIQVSSGGEAIYLKLLNDGWQKIEIQESPFQPDALILNDESLQANKSDAGIQFFVKPKLSQAWLPAQWLKSEGRFDFQEIKKAFQIGQDLLAETISGSVIWAKAENEYTLLDWRPTFMNQYQLANSQIVGTDQSGADVSFEKQRGWTDVTNEIDRTVMGQSERWTVQQHDKNLHFNASIAEGQKQVNLHLDERGGFRHQYLNRLSRLPGNSSFALVGSNNVTQYKFSDNNQNIELENHWAFQHPTEPVDIKNVYYDADGFILEMASNSLRLENGNWVPVQDFRKLDDLQKRLWKDESWNWQIDSQSGLTGYKTFENQATQYRLNQDKNRFERDTIHHVGLSSQSIWLSSATGLQAIRSNDKTLVDVSPVLNQNFYTQPDSQQLISVSIQPSTDSYLLLDGDNENLPQVQKNDVTINVTQIRQRLFKDPQWEFSSSGMTWRGQPTQILEGEFTQDRFGQFFSDASHWYVSSVSGLNVFSIDRNGKIQFEEYIAASENRSNLAYQLIKDQIVAFDDNKNVLKWDQDQTAWIAASDLAIEPVVEELEEWKFIRNHDGAFEFELENQPERFLIKDIFSSQRRFIFDEMQHQLLLDSELWFAGRGGVCLRNPESGQIVNWWRQGVDLTGNHEELGELIRISSFDSAANDDNHVKEVAIQSQDGRTWKFDRSQNSWLRQKSSPWSVPEGELVKRTSIADMVRNSEGNIELKRRSAQGDTGPVLLNGRLTTDVTKNFVFHNDEIWRATSGGAVRSTIPRPHDIAIYTVAGTDPKSLREPESIFQHSDSGGLIAVLNSEEVAKWDPETESFAAAQSPDEDIISNAQIMAESNFWNWSKWGSSVAVRFPILESQSTPVSLVTDERWSFDVVNSFRIIDSQILTTTPVGVLSINPENQQYVNWRTQALDESSQSLVAFDSDLRFTRGDSLKAISKDYSYSFEQDHWVREPRIGQLQRYDIKAGGWTWDVLPIDQGGFSVRLLNERKNLVEQHEILQGFQPDQLKDIEADGQKLWLTFDHGLYVLTAKSKIP